MLLDARHARRRQARRRGAAEPAAARLPRLRPPVRARPRRLHRDSAPACSQKRGVFGVALPRLLPALVRPLSRSSAATSSRPSTPARSACTCARRPARGSRRRRAWPTTSRRRSAQLIPKDQLETILDNLGVPNSGINLSYSNAGDDRHARRRDPALAQGRAPADRGIRQPPARRAAEALPRDRVLLPARRHRHPDPQLRPAGGDRRAVHRQRHQRQRRARRRSGQANQADPGRGRRARAPAPRRAGRQPADGPHAAAADGPVGAERRPERPRLALGQLADRAGVLAQPGQRRRLPRSPCRRRSTASTRSTRSSTCRSPAPARWPPRRRRRRRSCSATWSRRRRRASRPSSRATTSRRRSTSTSASRAPTSPASRRACRRSSTRSGRSCRAAARS